MGTAAQMVREQFARLIDRLERNPAPADAIVSDALTKFDAEGIADARRDSSSNKSQNWNFVRQLRHVALEGPAQFDQNREGRIVFSALDTPNVTSI